MAPSKLALFLALAALSLAAAQVPPPPPTTTVPPPPPTTTVPPPPPTPVPPPPPTTAPPPAAAGNGTCDPLQLRVCANVLNGTLVVNGQQCCPLLRGLLDFDAAACACIAVRSSILGVRFNVPMVFNLILSRCGRTTPPGFTCPQGV
ncbi:hypothetical protein ACP70R_009608 [Stipagrostis hirtigluma subsp. patula]